MHDQQSIRNENSIKLSSPTLSKLCLPCITARNYSRQHRRSKKTTQHRIQTIIPVESFQRFELAPRTYDTVVHSSDYARGNNANNIHEQQSSHFQILKEEKDDETLLVKIETQLTSSEIVGESVSTNELPRSNEDDVVGKRDEKKKELVELISEEIKLILSSFLLRFSFSVMIKRRC